MKKNELSPLQRLGQTIELHELAMEFRRTGNVNIKRWSPEAASGLGMTLNRLAVVDMGAAKAYAKKSADWALKSLGE
jgi:hypothetical protein